MTSSTLRAALLFSCLGTLITRSAIPVTIPTGFLGLLTQDGGYCLNGVYWLEVRGPFALAVFALFLISFDPSYRVG